MNAEILRRAATLMRERATEHQVSESPWSHDDTAVFDAAGSRVVVSDADYSDPDVAHIASWHPAVALAVADWLEFMSKAHEDDYLRGSHALIVARAYLGES